MIAPVLRTVLRFSRSRVAQPASGGIRIDATEPAMSEPLEDRPGGGGARAEVALATKADKRYWSDRFNVTVAQLEEAVSAVGTQRDAVEAYLRGQGAA